MIDIIDILTKIFLLYICNHILITIFSIHYRQLNLLKKGYYSRDMSYLERIIRGVKRRLFREKTFLYALIITLVETVVYFSINM